MKREEKQLAPKGKSLYEAGIWAPEDVMETVLKRMLETRPRQEVTLKPYMELPYFHQEPLSGPVCLDFEAAYPRQEPGAVAYAAAWLMVSQEEAAAFSLQGEAGIWLNGKQIYGQGVEKSQGVRSEGGWRILPVHLYAGKNELLVRCEKGEQGWGIRYFVSHPRYWMMWARDYLLNVRVTLPFAQMEGVEGMACVGSFPKDAAPSGLIPVLYGAAWEHEGRKYRWRPQWEEVMEQDGADFAVLYGRRKGAAYALTYCQMEEGETYLVEAAGDGQFTLWMDGEQKACGERIRCQVNGDGREKEILIKCKGNERGFSLEAGIYRKEVGQDRAEAWGRASHGVPFVKTGRESCARWLYLGPFPVKMLTAAPEEEIQFRRPYPLGDYKFDFWRLGEKSVVLRPYLDGIFFGQWFYAVQVGMAGVLSAGKALESGELVRYFLDSVQVMADYFDYSRWEYGRGLDPSMIPRACKLQELDPCGTIGVSMVEAYLISGNERLLGVARYIADRVMNHVLRFSDDTYYRGETMWADDFYMSCPFLARMARLTGETKYRERVYAQVAGFRKRLWIEERRLFSHIYFPGRENGDREMENRGGKTAEGLAGQPNRVPWGRGNGWIALALTEILELLEPGTESPRPRDKDWEQTLALYREFASGIATVQDGCGMWHQVLDDPDTYLETSCTAMFVVSLQRGLRHGWLDESFAPVAEKGWNALLRYSLDREGNVYGVCLGSGCSMEAAYYDSIPTHRNDDHGTGILLMAAAEMMKSGNK